MQDKELKELLDKSLMLMEQFQRRCDRIEQQLQGVAQVLQEVAQHLPQTSRKTAYDFLHFVPGVVADGVKQGLERPLQDYRMLWQMASSEINDGSRSLARNIRRMASLVRHLIWKLVGTVLFAMLLLFAAGMWLSVRYTQVNTSYQVSAELLKTIKDADVTLCGNGQLCAAVDIEGERYGDRKQYLPVKPR